ncbi:MAG: efflux RND transporter periplasmic adaptor subunit [Variovorax sp.]
MVQTRVAGYVERLSVRAPMERVRKGQALATLFAPEWLGPQNELLALQRAGVSPDLIAAARERMGAMTIPPELIRQSEKAGTAQARYVLTAPASGVVAELGVREGSAVTPGMTLFRIAGLEKVWAVAEVPEVQAVHLTPGQKVKAVLQADASRSFEGELKEILPEVSTSTRTLKARFEVDNAQGKLTPGMLLRLQVEGTSSTRLVVASEAVIRTGRRAVVIVRNGTGAFAPRDVSLARIWAMTSRFFKGWPTASRSSQAVSSSSIRKRACVRCWATWRRPLHLLLHLLLLLLLYLPALRTAGKARWRAWSRMASPFRTGRSPRSSGRR